MVEGLARRRGAWRVTTDRSGVWFDDVVAVWVAGSFVAVSPKFHDGCFWLLAAWLVVRLAGTTSCVFLLRVLVRTVVCRRSPRDFASPWSPRDFASPWNTMAAVHTNRKLACISIAPYHFVRTKSPPRTARFRPRLTHQTRVNAAYNDSAEATLHWGDYEMIDWGRVVSGELRASSYCVRKVNRSPIQSSWREKSNNFKFHAEGGGS